MSTIKTENRGRKFNAQKFAIVRAWQIARNAEVAHNTNPLNVAKTGLVKATEFFKESLSIAWVEAKAKQAKQPFEEYKLHKVPKKNQQTILNGIEIFVMSKESVGETPTKMETAEHIWNLRHTTGQSRSTNRHALHALAQISETGQIPEQLQDQDAYSM